MSEWTILLAPYIGTTWALWTRTTWTLVPWSMPQQALWLLATWSLLAPGAWSSGRPLPGWPGRTHLTRGVKLWWLVHWSFPIWCRRTMSTRTWWSWWSPHLTRWLLMMVWNINKLLFSQKQHLPPVWVTWWCWFGVRDINMGLILKVYININSHKY